MGRERRNVVEVSLWLGNQVSESPSLLLPISEADAVISEVCFRRHIGSHAVPDRLALNGVSVDITCL